MRKHTLYTHVEAGKIFWVIEWGWIDGLELSFNLSTRKWFLFKEGAEEEFNTFGAVKLLWQWKRDAESHIVIPMGQHKKYKDQIRSILDEQQ